MIRSRASSDRPASDPYAGNDKMVLVANASARRARKRVQDMVRLLTYFSDLRAAIL
jgi:hypothetical protein